MHTQVGFIIDVFQTFVAPLPCPALPWACLCHGHGSLTQVAELCRVLGVRCWHLPWQPPNPRRYVACRVHVLDSSCYSFGVSSHCVERVLLRGGLFSRLPPASVHCREQDGLRLQLGSRGGLASYLPGIRGGHRNFDWVFGERSAVLCAAYLVQPLTPLPSVCSAFSECCASCAGIACLQLVTRLKLACLVKLPYWYCAAAAVRSWQHLRLRCRRRSSTWSALCLLHPGSPIGT